MCRRILLAVLPVLCWYAIIDISNISVTITTDMEYLSYYDILNVIVDVLNVIIDILNVIGDIFYVIVDQ